MVDDYNNERMTGDELMRLRRAAGDSRKACAERFRVKWERIKDWEQEKARLSPMQSLFIRITYNSLARMNWSQTLPQRHT